MRIQILAIGCLLCASCVTNPRSFEQGDIRIVLPVQQEKSPNGNLVLAHWNDGGTVRIKITDATGKQFDVFFDRRFSTTESGDIKREPGTIYLNAYPARSNSVLVVDQEGFKKKILNGITY